MTERQQKRACRDRAIMNNHAARIGLVGVGQIRLEQQLRAQ